MASFTEMLLEHARQQHTAIVAEERSWSFGDLLERAQCLAGKLGELGLGPGEVVPALLGTTADAIALVIAGCLVQRPVAPLAARSSVRELLACIASLRARALVADASWAASGCEVAQTAGLRFAVLQDWAGVQAPRASERAAHSGDVVAVLHTSGTTGQPKAVPIPQARLAQRVRANAALLGLRPGCVYATASPFHHIAGLGMIFVALGAGAAVLPFSGFDTEAWRRLGRAGATHAMLVPTMIQRLLAEGALPIESLQLLQYGGAPIEVETLRAALMALPGVRFVQIFGQTEGSPITCLTHEDHLRGAGEEPALLRSVGRAVEGVELALEGIDDAGVGEVCARASHLFLTDADGWLRTGDLGTLDARGYLTLVGRRGDRIIRGGENVYPLEVERVLEEHAEVREAAVIGIPDRDLGERIRAFVVARSSQRLPSTEELRQHCRERLAGFKVPAEWEIVGDLPRNAAGKVLRHELRRNAREGRERGERAPD